MRIRFFKQTRWFEAYFEIEECRILDRFFDHQKNGNERQLWLGRCYLAVHFYRRKADAATI